MLGLTQQSAALIVAFVAAGSTAVYAWLTFLQVRQSRRQMLMSYRPYLHVSIEPSEYDLP
jgi:hypothetical protein